jgi:hypothetical protein
VTQPIIHDEPARGTVDYYRGRLTLAVDVNDLHSRSLGLISSALYDGEPTERLQRIENVLAVTNEMTSALLAPYRGESAIPPAPTHYQPSSMQPAMSCDVLLHDLPHGETSTFRLSDVTCTDCLDAVTTPALAARETR